MTVSTAVTFALGSILGMPQIFWAVIAALIVTQSSIGGSLKAALEQFIGSISGAIYGAAIALAIPHQSPLMLGLALVLAVAPLAILPTISPGFRIAPITAIIVLLSTIGVSLGPVGFAIERVLEVGMGCAVGLAVSFLIVPARAYDAVLKTAGQTASLVADQIELLAVVWDRKRAVVEIDALPTQIRTSLATLERLAERGIAGALEPAVQRTGSGAVVSHSGAPACGRQHTRPHRAETVAGRSAPALVRPLVSGRAGCR